MKSIATLQYDAEDLVQLVIRANPQALVALVIQDLAERGYAVSPHQLSAGPGGSLVVTDAQLAAPPPPPPAQPPQRVFVQPAQPPPQAPAPGDWFGQAAPAAPPAGWAPAQQPWQPPPQPQWQQQAPQQPQQAPQQAPQPLYVAEPLAPPAPRLQAPPPAAPAASAPLASRVFGAPHAAEVVGGLPVVPGEEVLGHTPTGTLFTRLGTRPSLAGAEEGGPGDGYPDLTSMQSDAPTITSRPGDGSDPRFNAVDIPDLEQPRQPRVREVGRASGLADKVQREGMFSDGAPPPRLSGTGGFAWNPQGPGQGDPAPRPSFLDAFVNNPNKE